MKKKIFFIYIFFLMLYNTNSQTITTNPIDDNHYCSGQEIKITYSTTGNFNQGNAFFVQMSTDTFKTFVNCPLLPGTVKVGEMVIKLENKQNDSLPFRFRVCSSDPYITGSDNGRNITIFTIPTGKIEINSNKHYYFSGFPAIGINDTIIYNIGNKEYHNSAVWEFGNDADPPFFVGYAPPPVKYSSPGIKDVYFTILKYKNCDFWSISNTKTYVLGCEVAISPKALIDSTYMPKLNLYTPRDSVYGELWILPNGYYKYSSVDRFVFIIETGGFLELSNASYCIFYIKPGASLKITSSQRCTFIKAPGAGFNFTLDSLNNKIIICPNLKYNYRTAPQSGVEFLIRMGYLDIQEAKISNDFQITPNPVNDILNITGRNPSEEIIIMSIQGIEIMKKIYTDKIDVSMLSKGLYFIKCGSKNAKFIKL
ncbi:MAG: T9SS type A sorting domain-containing protein [Candidatus Woesearchaeota archaeon]